MALDIQQRKAKHGDRRNDTDTETESSLDSTDTPLYKWGITVDLRSAPVTAVETLLRFKDEAGQICHFSKIVPDPTFLELSSEYSNLFHKPQVHAALQLFGLGYRYVSFNISTDHLLNSQWVQRASEFCKFVRSQYPNHGLVFEIIETPASEDLNELVLKAPIDSLRLQGAYFAIDDFGKRGASILRLCQLQLEYLKLDRSLVDTAISSVFARDLICALVSECHRHNISVIAEGVESQELSEAWRELNVTLQQGFLFDRPKSIDRLLG